MQVYFHDFWNKFNMLRVKLQQWHRELWCQAYSLGHVIFVVITNVIFKLQAFEFFVNYRLREDFLNKLPVLRYSPWRNNSDQRHSENLCSGHLTDGKNIAELEVPCGSLELVQSLSRSCNPENKMKLACNDPEIWWNITMLSLMILNY